MAPEVTAQDAELLRRELARRELARRRYAEYLPFVHGDTWKRTRLSEFLANEVQKFVETETGNAYDILVIATPPQHGKSVTITETFPSWYLGRYPRHRIILASYNEDSAERFLRRNREKTLQYGQMLWKHGIGSISRATEYELDNGVGRLISRGIMSGITGNPANLLLIDDPVKNREEADSESRRSKIWEEWQNSLKSRLAAGSKVILIMTPWHEDDIQARILASEDNVTYLRIPVEAEENDPLGRTPGDALCPELGKDNSWLADYKKSYLGDPNGGARAWQALYQCSPRVEGGNMIHRSWWRYYDPKDVTRFATEFISVDAAFKGNTNNDYVAIQVWGKLDNNYYLRYSLNKHLDFPATLQAIRTVRKLYPSARTVLIEDKANGSAIISTLQKEMFCIPVHPKGGKVARVNAVAPAIESGHVFLPNGQAWVSAFVDQFTAFPAGKNDDMVDACSQCLNYMLFSSGGLASTAPPTEVEAMTRYAEDCFLDSDRLFNVYGAEDSF